MLDHVCGGIQEDDGAHKPYRKVNRLLWPSFPKAKVVSDGVVIIKHSY